MASTQAITRSWQDVRRLCAAVTDATVFRLRLLEEIRRIVDFDAYVFLLTDPETSVGAAPLAHVPPPLLPRLPRLIRLKYLTEVNRWTALGAPVALLHQATDGEPARSLVWRELLAGYGVADVASLVFRDRYGCWGFLDLWRSGPSARFTPGDARFLAGIAEPVTAALRRSQASTFTTPAVRPPRAGPVVLLLSRDLDVLGQTPQTHDYLRALVPPEPGRQPIPASAYNVAAQLLAVEAGVDANPPWARVHLADGQWLTLRAAAIADPDPTREGRIAVSIEECTSAERMSLFARAFAVSPRERELLGHLMTGADTQETARLMNVSAHTVQDHLKSIFAKTGTRSRGSLLSRALGH